MSQRRASCACGKLGLTCEGEPVRISMCHCLACQQRTGSVFAVQARYPRDRVTIDGTAKQFVRTGDSGTPITFHFCGECGSTVYWEASWMEGFLAVAVGAFADPTFPAPTISVYELRRHPWIAAADHPLERMD